METNTFNLHDNNPRGVVINTPNNVAELLNEGPNGPSALYGQFGATLIDNYREAIAKVFKLKTGLNGDEVIKFGKFLKGGNFIITDSNTVGHGVLRAGQSYLLFRLINKLPKVGRILVLGCTVQEAIQLKMALPNVQFHFHVGTDSYRDNERMSKNISRCNEIIAKGTNAIKTTLARNFLNAYSQTGVVRNAGCFTICQDYSQIPGIVYQVAVSIDSLYDSTPESISSLMKKHQIKQLFSVRHVAYELKHAETIVNPVLGYEWRTSGDVVAMIFPDQTAGYTHKRSNIIEWSKDSTRKTGSYGSIVLSSSVDWKSCGYGLFSMTLEYKPKSLVRQYLTNSDQEVIYICSLPTLWKSGKVKLYPVTKAKYIALLNFVMSTETDAKKLVGYLRSSLSAFSIGSVLVDERWDLYSVDAYDIIIFAITHGIAQRTSIIDTIRKIGDFIKTGEFRDDPAWIKIIRFISDMLEKIAIWLGVRGKSIISLFHEFMQTGVSKVNIKKYWFAESMHFTNRRFNVPFNYQNAMRLLRNLAVNDGYGGPNSFARMSELLFGPQTSIDNTTNHASSKLISFFNPEPGTIGVIFGVAPGGMAIDLSEKCKVYTVVPSTPYNGYEPLKDKKLYSSAVNCLKYNNILQTSTEDFYPWPKDFGEKYSLNSLKMKVKGEALNTKPDWFVSDVGSASDHSNIQLGFIIDSLNAFEATKIKKGIIKIHASLNQYFFNGNNFSYLIEDMLTKYKLKIFRTDIFNPLSYEFYLGLSMRIVPLVGPAIKLKMFALKRRAMKLVYKPVYANWLRMEMWYNDHVATTCGDLVGLIPPPIGPNPLPAPPPAPIPDSSSESGSESDDSTTSGSDSSSSSDTKITIGVSGSSSSSDSSSSAEILSSEFELDEIDVLPEDLIPPAKSPETPVQDVKDGKQEIVTYLDTAWSSNRTADVKVVDLSEEKKPSEQTNLTSESAVDSADDDLIPRPFVDSDKEDEVKVQPVNQIGPMYQGYHSEVKLKAADVTKITLESHEMKTFKEDAASESINVEKGKYVKHTPARTGVIDQQLNYTARAVTDMHHDERMEELAEKMGCYYVPMAPYGMCFYNALSCLLAGTQWMSSLPYFQRLFLLPDLIDVVRWEKGTNTPKGNLVLMNTPVDEALKVLKALKVDALYLDRNLKEIGRSDNWYQATRWGFVVLWEKEIDGEYNKHADVFLYNKPDLTRNMNLHPNIRKPDNLKFPTTCRTIEYCSEKALPGVAQAFLTWIQSDSNLIQVNDLLKKMSITTFRFKIPLRFIHGPPGAGKTYLIAKYLYSLPVHLRKTIVYVTPRRKVRDEIAECIGNMAGIGDTIQAIAWADKHFAIKTYLKVFKMIDPKEKPMVSKAAVTEVMVDEYTLVPGLIIFGLAGLFPSASFTCIGDPFQTKLDLSAFPELKTGAVPITQSFQLKDLVTNSEFVTFSTSTYRFSSFGLKLARLAYRRNRFKPEIYAVDDKPFLIRILKPEERYAFTATGPRYAQLVDSINYLGTLPDTNYMTIAASQGMSVDTINLWLGPNTLDNLEVFQDTAYVGLTRAKHHLNIMCHSKSDFQRLNSQWLPELHKPQCPNSFISGKMGGVIGGIPNRGIFDKGDYAYEYAKEWAMRGRYVPDDEVRLDKTRVVRQKHVADPRRFDPFMLKSMCEVPEHIDNSREVMFNRAIEAIKAVIFKERINKIERETKKLSLFAFGKVHYAADSIASINTFVQRAKEHLIRSGYKKKILSRANFLRAVKTITDIFHSTFIDEEKYERIKNSVVVDQVILKAWAEFCAAAKFTNGNAELTWHEIRWRLSGFIKQQIKPKGKESGFENKGGQPVVQGEKAFNICFSLMFRVFKALSAACFKDEFKYATKMTEEEQYAHYKKYKDIYPDSWDDMADCTQYDATMDERTDMCEAARWKLFDPFDHNLEVYYWLKRNRPVYLKEMVYGISEARGSGQPDTEAGNTNTNMGYNAPMLNGSAVKNAQDKGLYVPMQVTNDPKSNPDFSWGPLGTMVTLSSYFDHNMMLAGLFIGDDCLIIIKKHAVFNMWFYQIIFMTKLKLDVRRNSSEFCNHIFSIHGFCYNPHKLVEKLMNKDFVAVLESKEKWFEFTDGLYMTINRYLANPEGANKACSDFFGKPVEYYDELWKQLDAFCQIPFEVIKRMPMYDVILRSDTYGGKFSSNTTETLITIQNVTETYAITKMSDSANANKNWGGKGKLKKDLKIAETAIKRAEKKVPEISGTPRPQRNSTPRKEGNRRKNSQPLPNYRPVGNNRQHNLGKMEHFEPALKKFLEGEMKAKETLNRDALKTVQIMSAPREASLERLGSRNAKPVNQKMMKLVLQDAVQDEDKINRYLLFKDVFRALLFWYKDVSATAMKYNCQGSIPYSEVSDPIALEEFVFTATSSDNGWHFPQIKQINWKAGDQCHGLVLFPGIYNGRSFLYKGPTDKIVMTITSNPNADNYVVRPQAFINGTMVEKQSVTISAVTDHVVVAASAPEGYYTIDFAKSGSTLNTLKFNLSIVGTVSSARWAHRCCPAVVRNLPFVGESRTTCASILISNFTPNIELQGSCVAMQPGEKDSWLDHATLSPQEFYNKIATSAYALTPVTFKKGFYGYVKPMNISEFDFKNSVDQNGADVNYAGFDLTDNTPYIMVATKVEDETSQTYAVTVTERFEFTTDVDGEMPEFPRFGIDSLEQAIQTIRPVPQWGENPSHLKTIWGEIKKIGVFAYKAYRLAEPIFQVASELLA